MTAENLWEVCKERPYSHEASMRPRPMTAENSEIGALTATQEMLQ